MPIAARTALFACALLAVGELLFLLLVFSSENASVAFPLVWSSLTLLALLITTRSILRGDSGSALAWAYIALPVVAGLMLLSLPILHLSTTFGDLQCDPIVGGCGPVSLLHWVPFILFTAAGISTTIAIGQCKRAESYDGRAVSREP